MGGTIVWLIGNLLHRLSFAELLTLEMMIEKAQREHARGDLLADLADTTGVIEDAVNYDVPARRAA